LAPEIKLDLTVPVAGRIGPITAQVVQRAPDGGYGLKLPDFNSEAGSSLKKLEKTVASVEAYLSRKSQEAEETPADPTEDMARLEARVAELEAELAARPVVDAMTAADPGAGPASVPDGGDEEPVDADSARSLDEETVAVVPVATEEQEAKPRGIPIVDVSAVAPTMEGITEGNAMRMGIMDIVANRFTGLFTLHQDDGTVRYAYFKSGGPVAWRTVPMMEREVLGMLLFKAGQISKEQLQESVEIMQNKGIRQGEAFIEMGVMSFSQLIMVLGKQNEFILQQVLTTAKGSWTFHVLPKMPEAFLPPPVRVGALLFRSMIEEAKKLRGQRLADQLRDYINQYVLVAEGRKALFADLGLNASERRLIAIIAERTIRMRELFSMSPLSRQNTAAVFYALIELGMFSFGERETHNRYLQRMGANISKKKRQLIQSTHFDVLEVHWISLPEEIDQGYEKLKEEYLLSSFVNIPEDLAETIQRINDRIDEAYNVLKDENQRREYRKTLVEDFMIVQSAELLSKKGEMAVMRQERQIAVDCFSKALELQPRSGEYRASLQRARGV
jgi:hypothetical protein